MISRISFPDSRHFSRNCQSGLNEIAAGPAEQVLKGGFLLHDGVVPLTHCWTSNFLLKLADRLQYYDFRLSQCRVDGLVLANKEPNYNWKLE